MPEPSPAAPPPAAEPLPPAPPDDDLEALLRVPVGWRAHLDDLTGGLASSALRPAVIVPALALAVAALAVWAWSPDAPAAVPDLPPVTTAVVAPPTAVDAPGEAAPTVAGGAGEGTGPATVHVVGAVARPGVRTLPTGTRVVDALDAAGGPTPDADLGQLNLAEPVQDGTQIRVPRQGEVVPAPVRGGAPTDGTASSPSSPVSLSQASPEELEGLPGVGPATAAAIVAHRAEHGPFRSVEDLLAVRGIGEKRLEALRDLVVP